MAGKKVWLQLYIGEDKSGRAFKIEVDGKGDVDDLANAVYQASAKSLEHCDPHQLNVYQAGTEFPLKGEAPLRPGKAVPTGTTDENPLRVVAPVNQSGQPLRPLLSKEVIAKIENSVCVLVEDGTTFGSGFAVSNSRLYTTAHHWEAEDDEGATYFAVAVGDKVECIFGKPSANKRYNLQVVKLDEHLDYCILEIIGEHTFTEWLETDVTPNLTLTTPVFFAANQIGIQDRLDEYEMGVTLGITIGTIVRRGNRHVVHSCASFKGDSGGAIVISNGKVIGLHMVAVNAVKELLDLTSVDFESVADSINQLCDAQSSGSVALLVSAIESL